LTLTLPVPDAEPTEAETVSVTWRVAFVVRLGNVKESENEPPVWVEVLVPVPLLIVSETVPVD
jgi:hypothetical protein